MLLGAERFIRVITCEPHGNCMRQMLSLLWFTDRSLDTWRLQTSPHAGNRRLTVSLSSDAARPGWARVPPRWMLLPYSPNPRERAGQRLPDFNAHESPGGQLEMPTGLSPRKGPNTLGVAGSGQLHSNGTCSWRADLLGRCRPGLSLLATEPAHSAEPTSCSFRKGVAAWTWGPAAIHTRLSLVLQAELHCFQCSNKWRNVLKMHK